VWTGIGTFVGQLNTACYIMTAFLFLGIFTLMVAPTEAITPEGQTIIISLQDSVATSSNLPDP